MRDALALWISHLLFWFAKFLAKMLVKNAVCIIVRFHFRKSEPPKAFFSRSRRQWDSYVKFSVDFKFHCRQAEIPLLHLLICIKQDGRQKSWLCPKHPAKNATTTNKIWILVYFDMLNLNLVASDLKSYSLTSLFA